MTIIKTMPILSPCKSDTLHNPSTIPILEFIKKRVFLNRIIKKKKKKPGFQPNFTQGQSPLFSTLVDGLAMVVHNYSENACLPAPPASPEMRPEACPRGWPTCV